MSFKELGVPPTSSFNQQWAMRDLNPRLSACKADTLATELIALKVMQFLFANSISFLLATTWDD